MTSSPDGRVGLAREKFTLILDKVIKHDGDDPTSLTNTYEYTWDFLKDEGTADLDAVDNGTQPPLPIALYPAGIEGTLSFMGGD